MAVYKVPQDVEAEDKLIGPFGFRQFAYLMVAGFGIFLGYLFFRIYPVMAVLPVPFVAFLIILALPLRKDQPMEIYLLALVRFYLKPKRRLWNPDGTVTYIEITVPVVDDKLPTKGISQEVAEQRLDYLARVMDSRGWAVKGVMSATANESITPTAIAESSGIADIMEDSPIARSFDGLLAKKTQQNRQNAVDRMRQTATAQTAAPARQTPTAQPAPPTNRFARNPYSDVLQYSQTPQQPTAHTRPQPGQIRPTGQGLPPQTSIPTQPAPASSAPFTNSQPHFNPYPTAIHQKIIDPSTPSTGNTPGTPPTSPDEELYDTPLGDSSVELLAPAPNNRMSPIPPQAAQNPSQNPLAQTVSPDIIRLASNTDLSISAIANEAHRLEKDEGDEVFIQIR